MAHPEGRAGDSGVSKLGRSVLLCPRDSPAPRTQSIIEQRSLEPMAVLRLLCSGLWSRGARAEISDSLSLAGRLFCGGTALWASPHRQGCPAHQTPSQSAGRKAGPRSCAVSLRLASSDAPALYLPSPHQPGCPFISRPPHPTSAWAGALPPVRPAGVTGCE